MSFTIQDNARMARVSKATVSAVLNDKTEIFAKIRRRVLDIVEQVNYQPNQITRSLHIPLTSLRVPAYQIGEKAAELLIEQINFRSEPFRKRIVLDADLVIRKSVASNQN